MADFVSTCVCPIDGLTMTLASADFKRNESEDRAHHLHIQVALNGQCLNSHQWRLTGELTLERR